MINLYIQETDKLWCGTAIEDDRIFSTAFASNEKDALRCLLKELPYNTFFKVTQRNNAFADEVLRKIQAVCDGRDVSFCFQFSMDRLSNYTKRVLKLTSLILTGYVTTYGALADFVGGSPRSVGRVMATNPFAPLIPCHRVVASDMTLCGYGGGLKTKWDLLQKENRKYSRIFVVNINEKSLKLFPVDNLKPSTY